MTNSSESRGQVDPAPVQKKPYKTPQLVVYGDLQTITRAVGVTGSFDPPPHPMGANRTRM